MKKFAEPTAHGRNNKKSINLSDLIEEQSYNSIRSVNCTPIAEKHPFKPSEFSARSTIISDASKNRLSQEIINRQQQQQSTASASPSVEQILAASFDENVRDLETQLEHIKLRQSMGSSGWRRHTADLSLNSSVTSLKDDWKKGLRLSDVSDVNAEIAADEQFISSSQVSFGF